MKKSILFLAAFSVSTFVVASNISSGDEMQPNYIHMNNEQVSKNFLKNKKMQRLHWQMTREAMSESGMEARLKMMTEEGRAYHEALERREKKTAG